MQLFIVDAFTDQLFGGNQAGVVLLRDGQSYPEDQLMQKIAAELKHSETAFVKRMEHDTIQLRYFTPEGEVPLCGHATISAFTVMRKQEMIACGNILALTAAGELRVSVEPNTIWLEMPQGERVKELNEEESARVYRAYGLTPADQPDGMQPYIVKVGLADILLPVSSKIALDHAVQDRETVIALSKEFNVTGVHLYHCPKSETPNAYCRNFAPLYGIDEESATGTSNASLSYYLQVRGRLKPNEIYTFLQGETMGKPSVILSRVDEYGRIWIGGNAVITISGDLRL